MSNLFRTISVILQIVLYTASLSAIPAIPYPIEIRQPDGSIVTILMKGDERGYSASTIDGVPVIRTNNGIFEYRDPMNPVRSSGLVAHDASFRTAQERDWISSSNFKDTEVPIVKSARRPSVNAGKYLRISDYPTIGRMKSLVVLIEFDDCSFTTIEDPYAYYDGLLNQKGFSYKNGANGSARDYYNYNSCGKFDPDFVVVGPIKLSGAVASYGSDTERKLDPEAWRMIEEACKIIDSEIDFSEFDNDGDGSVDSIYFFYAGYGQADSGNSDVIWPHNGLLLDNWDVDLVLDGKRINNYACSNEIRFNSAPLWMPVGIGTFVHEFGHVLGLVDHYDTLYTSNRSGVTEWDTMAGASYNNNQNTPPAFSAYERAVLGWADLKETPPHHCGPLYVRSLDGTTAEGLRITVPDTEEREFFVIERRTQYDWDSTLPAEGILVWHIKEDQTLWETNRANADPVLQCIDIIEADGSENNATLHGDVFPGTSNVTEFDFDSYSNKSFFGFDHVKEYEDYSIILLKNTEFIPMNPDLHVKDIHGTSFSMEWDSSEDALGYLVSVTDPDGNPVNGYNLTSFDSPAKIDMEGLTPNTSYMIDLRAVAGNYISQYAPSEVTTGEMEFFESCPEKPTVYYDGEKDEYYLNWKALNEAEDYSVTISRMSYGEPEDLSYGFEKGLDNLPSGWSTSSTSLSRSLFGSHSPALQLSSDGDLLEISYPEGLIRKLSLYQRTLSSSNQLSIRCLDNNDTIISSINLDGPTSGKVESIPIADGTVCLQIEFKRSAGYIVIDDLIVSVSFQNMDILPGFEDIRTSGATSYRISKIDRPEECVVNVRGINNGVFSRPSASVALSKTAIVTPTVIKHSDHEDSMYDLSGKKIDPNTQVPGLYIKVSNGKIHKHILR